MFVLDNRLNADTHVIGDLALSRLLLMDDARYPWVILVPRLNDVREVIDLDPEQQSQLWHESALVSTVLRDAWPGDKLNMGALGNLVPQLHVHHILRRVGDPAWPGPVWGHSSAQPYAAEMLHETLQQWQQALVGQLL